MAKKNKEVTKVVDINREFVEKFAETATDEEIKWIMDTIEELIKEKGEKGYFAAFRMEFAKKFMPELIAKKKVVKKKSMLDNLGAILEKRIAA